MFWRNFGRKRIRVEINKEWKSHYISKRKRTCTEFFFYIEYHKKKNISDNLYSYNLFLLYIPGVGGIHFPFAFIFLFWQNLSKKTDTSCKLIYWSTIFCILPKCFWNNFFKKVKTNILNVIDLKKNCLK